MESLKCFFLEETKLVQRGLRRYGYGGAVPCTSGWGHDAVAIVDTVESEQVVIDSHDSAWPHDDPRWPVVCETCDYHFGPQDKYQLFCERIYRRLDTGDFLTLQEAPVGAMWYADWMLTTGLCDHRGPDGHCLVVMCPGQHRWYVDSKCGNCSSPQDTQHKCWVRHGEVPDIHVDKDGLTCSSGDGSVQVSGFSVFLTHGYLSSCDDAYREV